MSNELDKPVSGNSLGGEVAISNMNGGFLPAPANIQDAVQVAQLMAKAGPMVGKAFRNNPGACLAIYMQAGRLGMDPFALSLKSYEVNGSIAYEAQAVASMVYSAPILEGRLHFEYQGEGDSRKVLVTGRVKGNTAPCVYESPPLSVMREGGKSPLWRKDPDQQMAYYSTRAWARRWVPDVLMGVYSVDEMEDAGMVNVTPDNKIDDAAARLTANLDQFEKDREAALSDPDEAVIIPVEEVQGEPAIEAFDGIVDYTLAVEQYEDIDALDAAESIATACAWASEVGMQTRIAMVTQAKRDELKSVVEAA